METRSEMARLWLYGNHEISSKVKYYLILRYGTVEQAMEQPVSELEKELVKQFEPAEYQTLLLRKNTNYLDEVYGRLKERNIRILYPGHPLYPEKLTNIYDKPEILFARGKIRESINYYNQSVAIVGARNADTYCKETTRIFARELAKAGIQIVSGLARGIDGQAHRGCLEAGGYTIAVKLEKPIQYSSSAYFGKNLQRHVQLSYPTYDFNGYYFELDNEGNPYYICPVLKPNAGLFGAKDVKGIVICDPCSGDCEYMDLGDIPNWVDRVYDGDLLCDRYNWYGMLSGGFINSKIGNKGCKVTTDDYGYKVMDGDVWVYTGVTSVNGDQSNIGFVLMNSRTAESKYFAIAGAEEHSAMSSAEGQVQNLGYTSSFPSLINIGNVPTYIMVLKDNAGLVKMYALVNVEKYSIVATGATQKEALASYRKLLAENSITTSGNDVSEDTLSKKITVTQIRYITVENETYVYITAKDRSVYKQNFAENESLIKIEEGDVITVHYMEGDDGVNTLFSYE